MRCIICNNVMEPMEIKQNKVTKEFEPCSACLTEVFNTLKDYEAEDEEEYKCHVPVNS